MNKKIFFSFFIFSFLLFSFSSKVIAQEFPPGAIVSSLTVPSGADLDIIPDSDSTSTILYASVTFGNIFPGLCAGCEVPDSKYDIGYFVCQTDGVPLEHVLISNFPGSTNYQIPQQYWFLNRTCHDEYSFINTVNSWGTSGSYGDLHITVVYVPYEIGSGSSTLSSVTERCETIGNVTECYRSQDIYIGFLIEGVFVFLGIAVLWFIFFR